MQTLYRAVARHEECGGAALYFENKTVSFKTLLCNIRKALTYLKRSGIGADDVITMALPNIPQTVYLFYAADALGARLNIIHPLSTVPQIFAAMERTGSRHAILLETLWQDGHEALTECPYDIHFVNPMYERGAFLRRAFYFKYKKAKLSSHIHSADMLYRLPQETAIHDRDPEQDSVYLHSGGTTGEPKIIALSDRALCNLADKVKSIVGEDPSGKSMLCVLPIFHGFGLDMGLHGPLSNRMASAIMMKFDAKKAVKWINEGKVNMIIGVPVLYEKLMACEGFESARLERLTHCFVGGDNVHTSQIERFERIMRSHGSGCRLLEGYGLTETVTVCSVNTKENNRIGSVGRPLCGIRIQIRDESMKVLPARETGEVFVCSDTQMNGYKSDKQATESAMLSMDGDIWIRTGDLGYLDGDGYLFLKGRKKRVFKISGINVYPAEIEKTASEHPGVHEAALEYFEAPKPHTVLFLIKDRDSDISSEQIKEEVREMLEKRFLKYELPTDIVFMDEFPRTKVGKIDHKAFESR